MRRRYQPSAKPASRPTSPTSTISANMPASSPRVPGGSGPAAAIEYRIDLLAREQAIGGERIDAGTARGAGPVGHRRRPCRSHLDHTGPPGAAPVHPDGIGRLVTIRRRDLARLALSRMDDRG